MKYKIIVDKQSRTNPSNEKREYVVNIEELRVKGEIYDSLIITRDEAYVMRRLSLSECHVLRVLEEPIKEKLDDLNIELFEGDNYIYLVDMVGNKFYVEYLIKNDFNDIYVTQNEMNSAINQTAQSIELSVNQKLEEYSTTKEVQALIKILSDAIALEVTKKVGENEIINKINLSTEGIVIDANKVDIKGKKVSFKTNIESQYNYTSADLENIRNYITETYQLTDEQKELYDINKDGKVSPADYVLIRNLIDADEQVIIKGTFEIDPDSAGRSLILRSENGNIITSIGLLGMQTESFNSEYLEVGTATVRNLVVSNSFTNNSDRRMKREIKELSNDFCGLLQEILPVSFRYNNSEDKHIGFIAQDVEKVFKNNKLDEVLVKIDETGKYTLDYIQLIGVLWKIVQELEKRIENLEKEVKNG